MNTGRRVVASVAVGLAMAVIASMLVTWLYEPSNGGWFMYSPNSEQAFDVSADGTDWKTPAIWLAAIGIWFAVSWRLFRSED